MTLNNKTYKSMQECSRDTGTPVKILRAAKARPDAVGFNKSGRIDWSQAGPFIQAHYNELEEDSDVIAKWKLRKLQSETRRAELAESKEKGLTLDRDKVLGDLTAICLAQKNILRAKLCQELPPKLLGMSLTEMSVEMERVLNEICNLLHKYKLNQ